ncbi:MAG: transcription termination/antitermination protein NusG [Patescibacteria group bacterium]|nr:transcription termination/antitermination protein NusG [Patescibacteria group bacterium]
MIQEEIKKTKKLKKKKVEIKLSSHPDARWFVIHTYSGYEDQVAKQLRQRIKSLSMGEKIFQVVVPKEKQVELKGGEKKLVNKHIYPGYVMVEMIVSNESWYVVRNTPNVTGFIGFGTKPSPIDPVELNEIFSRMQKKEATYAADFKAGDHVRITRGTFKDFDGVVEEVDESKGKVKILVNMFGRETPVEVDFTNARKI